MLRILWGALALGCAALTGPSLAQDDAPEEGGFGIDPANLDRTVDPGDDFYAFANGGWIARTEIPAGRPYFSAPWAAQAKALTDVTALLDELLARPSAEQGTAERRIQDFHRSYLDVAAIEARGTAPIEPGLAEIAAITSHDQVARWMAKPTASSLFHTIVKPPVDMQGGYVLSIEQYRTTGLGLPSQAHYTNDEDSYVGHRAAYRDYIARSFKLAGVADGTVHAERVLSLETRFAEVMWDFARLRDAGAAFNLVNIAELEARAPGFPWRAFLDAKGLGDLEQVNFGIGGLTESAALFAQIPVEDWRSYLAFHWIENHAAMLPEAFGEHRFSFFDQRLYGVAEREDRTARATEFIQRELGWDIGALYVAEYFPPSHSEQVLEIAAYVRRAFREQLDETEWMDDATRAEALAKVDAIIFEMAEPQVRTNLSALETRPDDLIGNVTRLRTLEWERQRRRIGQPIVRFGDWNMYPHRIGLGFHQQYNKIFVTAGALQAPFFDSQADMAVNFGAIGSTLGHEFGHSLDDQGSRFDSAGALRDWWSEESRAAYEAQTGLLVEQFGAYQVLPGVALRSGQMLGEIVGDLTGALIARRAFELYLEDNPGEADRMLGGFTGPQRFWIGLAQQARTVSSAEALRNMALNNAHPPPRPRINLIVNNLDEWYADWGIEPDDALYLPPEQRVRLW